MPFVYHVLGAGTLVHVVGWGDLTLSDALEVWNAKRQDPLVRDGHALLCDVTKARKITLSAEDYPRLRQALEDDLNRTASRVAIIADRNFNWSASKAWEAQADQLGRACITFNDVRTACIWLGIDEETFQQVQQQKQAALAAAATGENPSNRTRRLGQ